ncbi:MAG: hypothetical protein AB2598_10245 [Candidatus Thiodiazotropha sp.]
MHPTALLSCLLLIAILLLGSGCSTNRTTKGAVSVGEYGKPATWLRAAEERERKGDLQAALFNLKLARTVTRQDRDIDREIKRVEAKIDSQSGKLMKRGKQAVSQGQFAKARRHYLRVLSLNPKHKPALEAMRELNERTSKASMKKKVARSISNYNNRAKKKKLAKGFHEEAYIYSRQELLQADDKSLDPRAYIEEIEAHLKKYPKDKEVRGLLSKTLQKQIDNAFESGNYSDALRYLEKAEQAFISDAKRLEKIQKQRKAYGKLLYIKGVRSSRDEPEHAIRFWEYALKFDPDDRKSRLRLRNIQAM